MLDERSAAGALGRANRRRAKAIARIEGARHLDEAGVEYIEDLPRDTLLVFHCHHGIRSQSAGQHFVAKGFTNVCNVVGGIEAWSLQVDGSVPRY